MIEHQGAIRSVSRYEVIVEIINSSSCSSCKAKSICSLSTRNVKQLSLPIQEGECWQVGEEVKVVLSTSLGLKAVFLIYILPLFLLLSVLFIFPYFNVSELFTGLSALLAPLFYYAIIWLFQSRIEKEVIFALKKLNPV